MGITPLPITQMIPKTRFFVSLDVIYEQFKSILNIESKLEFNKVYKRTDWANVHTNSSSPTSFIIHCDVGYVRGSISSTDGTDLGVKACRNMFKIFTKPTSKNVALKAIRSLKNTSR
jgi:hypothetical protein